MPSSVSQESICTSVTIPTMFSATPYAKIHFCSTIIFWTKKCALCRILWVGSKTQVFSADGLSFFMEIGCYIIYWEMMRFKNVWGERWKLFFLFLFCFVLLDTETGKGRVKWKLLCSLSWVGTTVQSLLCSSSVWEKRGQWPSQVGVRLGHGMTLK